jgi:hypothetical protein
MSRGGDGVSGGRFVSDDDDDEEAGLTEDTPWDTDPI